MNNQKESKSCPKARVEQYLTDLTLKNGRLWCPWCEEEINNSRKSTIDYHAQSLIHLKNKSAKQSGNLANFIPLKSDSLKDFVLALMCSGIPLFKVSTFESFFLKRRLPSLVLLSYSKLVTELVPSFYNESITFIKTTYKKSPFVLLVDESKDSKSRSVLNTIAYFIAEKEYILLDISFSESSDNFLIVKCEQKVIEDFDFSWKNCYAIASDNAPVMKKAIEKIKELHNPKILHIRCVAHIVNLAIGLICDNEICDYFRKVMKMWSKFMRKVKGSQVLYLKYLKDHGFQEKLFPRFVKIRWVSFWEACQYLHENLSPIKQFIIENDEKFGDGKFLKK